MHGQASEPEPSDAVLTPGGLLTRDSKWQAYEAFITVVRLADFKTTMGEDKVLAAVSNAKVSLSYLDDAAAELAKDERNEGLARDYVHMASVCAEEAVACVREYLGHWVGDQ